MKAVRIITLAVAATFIFVSVPGNAHAAGVVDPDSYPMLGPEEMGQLRFVISVANQEIDDFTYIDPVRITGAGDSDGGRRYVIAFSIYFLALEQYEKLPACPEIIEPALDRMIQKLIHKRSWQYWARTSQGVPLLEPFFNRPYPESHDPVIDQNIMYSGHLGHAIGLQQTLYRDFRYDKPGSIVFKWDESEKYVYDNHELQKIMYNQMKNNPWKSIACEPNAVFPSCNQHPIMSFMLYDYGHGSSLSQVSDEFLDSFLKHRLIDPRTHHAAAYYLVKQDLTVSGGHVGISASMDGWAGYFMHVWQPDYIERHYPAMKRDQVVYETDETARLRLDYGPGQSLKYGYFAMLAGEVGDVETRDKLIAQADRTYLPVWEDGKYYYPADRPQAKIPAIALTGALLALARASSPGAVSRMHLEPFDDRHFNEPMVKGVDFPTVLLLRAIYDRDARALVLTTAPGRDDRSTTSMTVTNLDPGGSYNLYIDGKNTGTISGREHSAIEVPLDGRHNVVVQMAGP